MAQIRADEISRVLREEIENYEGAIDVSETGSVISVGDGIARIYGLEKVMAGELIEFPHNVAGIAMNLEEDQVGSVLLGDYTQISEGDEVRRTKRIMSVPVGDEMVGRVVNALGEPIDGKGPILTKTFFPVERLAPGVVERMPVKEPLQTGIKAIDVMLCACTTIFPSTPRRIARSRCCCAVRRAARRSRAMCSIFTADCWSARRS